MFDEILTMIKINKLQKQSNFMNISELAMKKIPGLKYSNVAHKKFDEKKNDSCHTLSRLHQKLTY